MPHPFEALQFNKANLLRLLGSLTTGVVQTFSAGSTGFTPSSATAGAVALAGTLNVANGGTAATSLTANGVLIGRGAVSAVVVTTPGTTGTVLTGVTGSAPTFQNISAQAVTTWAGGTTGLTPAAATSGVVSLGGILVVANGGTGVSTSTGTGAVVLNTSATLVTPALGTPASGVLSNCTGFPTATGASTFLGADVPVVTSGVFVNGPNTGSIGANGQTWLIKGTASVLNSAGGNVTATARLFNGAAGIAATASTMTTGFSTSISLNAVVSLSAATTFTLQLTDNAGGSNTNLQTTSVNGTANKGTAITAIRLS